MRNEDVKVGLQYIHILKTFSLEVVLLRNPKDVEI
jgi:hypothetical protein